MLFYQFPNSDYKDRSTRKLCPLLVIMRRLILFLGLCSLAAFGHANEASSQITKFHVNTNIQMRYAVTKVEMQVKNMASEASEVFFDMFIPQEAFVSNFSMDIKGQTYVAKVETKEEAKEIYDSSSTSSGLVQSQSEPEFKDGKQVRFLSHFFLF